jgi:hypothetical protein
MRFGSPEDVLADGAPIQGQNVSPCVVDWDGDGVPDLITGDTNGLVMFYKGKRTSNGLTFAKGVELIGPRTFPNENDRPAARAKVAVADWNGDGKLDLIVGDFSYQQEPPKNLTAAQRKRLKELQAKQQTLSGRLSKIYEALSSKIAKELGVKVDAQMTQEQSKAFAGRMQKEMAASKEYQAIMPKWTKLYQELSPLQGRPQMDGFVRVYLRK